MSSRIAARRPVVVRVAGVPWPIRGLCDRRRIT